jgi:hypothetical protein
MLVSAEPTYTVWHVMDARLRKIQYAIAAEKMQEKVLSNPQIAHTTITSIEVFAVV